MIKLKLVSRGVARMSSLGGSAIKPPSAVPTGDENEEEGNAPTTVNEELKRLRYSHHRTAFDVDIDALETHPWRGKNADISDYFNYGFNEKTWQVLLNTIVIRTAYCSCRSVSEGDFN